MSSFRGFDRQFRRVLSTIGIAAVLIVPSFVPAFGASALDVTARSVQLSSASVNATNVTYNVTFTPATTVAAGGAVSIDFCTGAAIGDTCTAPDATFTAAGAATATSGYSVASATVNRVIISSTAAMTAGTPVNVVLTGINNPSTAGTIYARIVTYDTVAHATADTTESSADVKDSGTVALSMTNTMNVSGSVLESMTFCVSGATTDTNPNPIKTGCSGTLVAPSLKLGDQIGTSGIYVLGTSAPSTADVYTQLSTNAVGGAVVSLKNNVSCGGMKRVGATVCDIAPALKAGISTGDAKFGVLVNPDATTNSELSATGSLEAVPSSGYNGSTYALNYASDGLTGVTSPYGDPILDTFSSSTPTQPLDQNMKLTFGAQAANNTPAGTYSADMSLVATGTF